MPITVSYDLTNAGTNERNYIRSAFERFAGSGWVGVYSAMNWKARKIG